ncbi:MAG: hypothetical protein RR139_07370 [Lachnospiraceae bacterium]
MKIAFWSGEEQVGTTFNLAAVACTAVLMHPVSIAVIPGGYQDEGLQKQFYAEKKGYPIRTKKKEEVQRKELVAEQETFFVSTGLDYLLCKEKQELTEKMIKENMHPVIRDKMYCMPCGRRQYHDWWNTGNLFKKMEEVTDALESCFDLVFVDCGNRRDDFSQKMLQEAEVCVLNMEQEEEQIGDYFRNRPKLKGKVFFMVGNYFENSAYTRKNLQRIYRIEEQQIGIIPYNAQLQTAGGTGKTGKYMNSYLEHGGTGKNLEFEKEIVRDAQLILKLAGAVK